MSGPVFHGMVRIRVATALRREHGLSFADARELSHSLTAHIIDHAMTATEGAVGAIGDGAILQKLIDFLNSPTGQMLIQLLVKILMGL